MAGPPPISHSPTPWPPRPGRRCGCVPFPRGSRRTPPRLRASADVRGHQAQSCLNLGRCQDLPKLGAEAVKEQLGALSGMWRLDAAGTALEKKFTAKNWAAAMGFFNSVSDIAEGEGHHPDLHLENYRDVRVTVSTHAVAGLTQNDFILAAKIDGLKIDDLYSPKWLRQWQAAQGGEATG